MTSGTQKARCIHCRAEVAVPDSYAHGDHIKCGSCGTKHKVSRGDTLRIVLADVGPLREALADNIRLVERLEDEIQGARRSLGIGVNGLGIGVLYAIVQIGLNERPISRELGWEAIGIAVLVGIGLELANHLFLAKRQRIQRLSADLKEARNAGRHLQKVIREAGRV
jgi:DNA-directed RNA polymerase subunit RPC12/RpoP